MSVRGMKLLAFVLCLTQYVGCSRSPDAGAPRAPESDSAEVAQVVDAFHSALTAGDSMAASSLLAEDALILESGGLETLEEYRSHHLPGDIAFAQAVTRERRRVRVEVRGDVAWAVSTSITTGEFRSRQINSQGTELMVLVRTDQGGWRISAIHWSSRARRGQGG